MRVAGRHTQQTRRRLVCLLAFVALGRFFEKKRSLKSTVPPWLLSASSSHCPAGGGWLQARARGGRFICHVTAFVHGNGDARLRPHLSCPRPHVAVFAARRLGCQLPRFPSRLLIELYPFYQPAILEWLQLSSAAPAAAASSSMYPVPNAECAQATRPAQAVTRQTGGGV